MTDTFPPGFGQGKETESYHQVRKKLEIFEIFVTANKNN